MALFLAVVATSRIAMAGAAPVAERRLLTVGDFTVQAEVAATATMRRLGLSGRAPEAEDVAMLFVFPRAERPCFWMKNTLLPLHLVFIDAQGVIRQQAELAPGDERRVCAHQPVRWALEVSARSPGVQQLRVGQQVQGLPKLASPGRWSHP